ncbi:MAG: anti-sigma F factor [Christensenellaceae bacterium]|nr:anti-sigma F factor [Christensenellaceae bacterium]
MGKEECFLNMEMEMQFLLTPENESFARVCAAAFAARLDPTMEEIADIKTALSEAISNAYLHAYGEKTGLLILRAGLCERTLIYEIEDRGIGIRSIEEAMQPFFTTSKNEARSGMGFTLMQAFMDEVEVTSEPGKGTKVILRKVIPH